MWVTTFPNRYPEWIEEEPGMAIMPDMSGRARETQSDGAKFELPASLSNPNARQVAMSYARLAAEMIQRCPDGEELSTGLRKLHEARGFHMRAVASVRETSGPWR